MIKKWMVALLIGGIFWGLTRQLNPIPGKSNLVAQPLNTEIKNKVIESITYSGKNLPPNEINQPKNIVLVEADPIISNNPMKNVLSDNSSPDIQDVAQDKVAHSENDTLPARRINFTWNGIKLIAITVNHSDEIKTDTPEQQIPSKETSDNSKTNKMHCPAVEKIRQAAPQINDAFFSHGTYQLFSYEAAFQDDDLTWMIGARGIVADSSDEAIYKAILTASETNHHKNDYAEIIEGGPVTLYFCSYGPGDIIAAGIPNEVLVEE